MKKKVLKIFVQIGEKHASKAFVHLFTLTNYKVVFYCVCSESNMEEKKIASNKERKRKKIRLSIFLIISINFLKL